MPRMNPDHGSDDRHRRGGMKPGIHAVADHGRQCELQADRRDSRSPFEAQGQCGPRLRLLNHARLPLPDAPGITEHAREACSHQPGSSVDRTQSSRLRYVQARDDLKRPVYWPIPPCQLLSPGSRNFSQSPAEGFMKCYSDVSVIFSSTIGACPQVRGGASLSDFEHRRRSTIDRFRVDMVCDINAK